MPSPLNPRRGQLTASELAARAGHPQPKYQPIVVDTRPSTRPGWLDVEISLAPGTNVTYRVPEAGYGPRSIATILETAPHVFSPLGLTADPFAPE